MVLPASPCQIAIKLKKCLYLNCLVWITAQQNPAIINFVIIVNHNIQSSSQQASNRPQLFFWITISPCPLPIPCASPCLSEAFERPRPTPICPVQCLLSSLGCLTRDICLLLLPQTLGRLLHPHHPHTASRQGSRILTPYVEMNSKWIPTLMVKKNMKLLKADRLERSSGCPLRGGDKSTGQLYQNENFLLCRRDD